MKYAEAMDILYAPQWCAVRGCDDELDGCMDIVHEAESVVSECNRVMEARLQEHARICPRCLLPGLTSIDALPGGPRIFTCTLDSERMDWMAWVRGHPEARGREARFALPMQMKSVLGEESIAMIKGK